MPVIHQNNTMSYMIHYGIDNCNTSLYKIEKSNIFNLTINTCYNFSDHKNYSNMFIECLTTRNIEYNDNNKANYDINRIIFTFSLLIVILLILLILYFLIRLYFDKLESNYKELSLISDLQKNTPKRKDNIIPVENNTEYNTFDNI